MRNRDRVFTRNLSLRPFPQAVFTANLEVLQRIIGFLRIGHPFFDPRHQSRSRMIERDDHFIALDFVLLVKRAAADRNLLLVVVL